MSIERDTRCGLFGTHWWLVNLYSGAGNYAPVGERPRPRRRLMLEPYSPLSMGTATRLDAWIEEERALHIWEAPFPQQKPKGHPVFRVEWKRLDATYRSGCTGTPSLGFSIIRALARNELVGESAKDAMQSLFWSCFVEDGTGLNYLCKHADRETGVFYARQRLDWQLQRLARAMYRRTSFDDNDNDKDPVVALLKETAYDDYPLLGLRAWERAVVDDTFYDALAALAALSDTEERHVATIKFLKLHKSKRTP